MSEGWNEEKLKLWWVQSLVAIRQMGFTPSEEQLEILRCTDNLVLVTGGEQAGKSYLAGCYFHIYHLFGRLYWLVGSDYEQCQPEFRYIIQGLGQMGAVQDRDISMPQRGAWRAKAYGGKVRIETKTAVDVRKLAREAPDGIIMCEAAQMGYDVYKKLRGRMAPRDAWMLMIGTLEAPNDWFAQFWRRWQATNPEGGKAFTLPSWSNLSIYPDGYNDVRIQALKRELPPDEFDMRFGAVPHPPETLIFREFDFNSHVPGDIEYNKDLPVYLWIDPGYSGSFYAVEVVQIAEADDHFDGRHIHVIDELYTKYATTPEIIEVCAAMPWREKVEGGVIDIAGTQHHAGQSHLELWASEGIPLEAGRVEVHDGIVRHKTFLSDPASGKPRIFFNENCVGAFREYGLWKRRKIMEGMNQIAKPEVVNCDALKAISYGLVAMFGFVEYKTGPIVIRDPFS